MPMQPDDKLCYCFHVSLRKVNNFIRVHQPKVPSQISECGGAGTGCGWCVPFLKRCFEAARKDLDSVQIPMSAAEYGQQRSEYVRREHKHLPPGATPVTSPDEQAFDSA